MGTRKPAARYDQTQNQLKKAKIGRHRMIRTILRESVTPSVLYHRRVCIFARAREHVLFLLGRVDPVEPVPKGQAQGDNDAQDCCDASNDCDQRVVGDTERRKWGGRHCVDISCQGAWVPRSLHTYVVSLGRYSALRHIRMPPRLVWQKLLPLI